MKASKRHKCPRQKRSAKNDNTKGASHGRAEGGPDLNAKIRAAPQSAPHSENNRLVVGVHHSRLDLSS